MMLNYQLASDYKSFWIKVLSKYGNQSAEMIGDKLSLHSGMHPLSVEELKELADILKKYIDFNVKMKEKIAALHQEAAEEWTQIVADNG